MKKRTDAEMFDAILDHAELDAAFDGATDEEIAKDLEKAGYTKEKLAEMAKKHLPPAPPKVVPISSARKWSTRFVVGGMGLSFAAAMGMTILFMLFAIPAHPPEPTVTTAPTLTPTMATPSLERAKAVRDHARKAFFEHNYPIVLQDLEDAKTLDAQGDSAPDVQDLRAETMARLFPDAH